MYTWKDISNLLFPDIKDSISDLEIKYSPRVESFVSRFAPSPTGFLHIGAVYASFVPSQLAKQNGGIFILRIEDTDQKRSTDSGLNSIISGISNFGIPINEGPIGDKCMDIGKYGPYIQSKRKHLYHVFIKELVSKGLAYPCWMSNEQVDNIREQQKRTKIMPGIYGNYSVWRNKSIEEIIDQIKIDNNCVIRFRGHSNTQKKIFFDDVIRGRVAMIDSYNDLVLMKSDDKLPTYHLAHIVDDYLMRVTHVIRAEERLTSVPLHLQLRDAFGLKSPSYAHLPQILKFDNETGKKRKLSKRKDPEADVEHFFVKGYSKEGILEYLLGLIDSGFESRRKNNLEKSYFDYKINLDKINKSGAIFDLVKLNNINNNYISRLSNIDLYNNCLIWAEKYNKDLYKHMDKYKDYTIDAISIERLTTKDPKRFSNFEDVKDQLVFFYDEERQNAIDNLLVSDTFLDKRFGNEKINKDVLSVFVKSYISDLNLDVDIDVWFDNLKNIGKTIGFASNNAEFKSGGYIGKIGDLAMFLRLSLCGSYKTPDLYSVMKVMGKSRINYRTNKFLELIS